jgi:hypothetical protein
MKEKYLTRDRAMQKRKTKKTANRQRAKNSERSHETWLAELRGCHAARQHKQLVIGDALVQAQRDWSTWYGPKAQTSHLWQQAADATSHPTDSLFQYARVAAVFPPKSRIYDISFSSYHAIAGISDERQRIALCEKAEKKHLSCEQVRLLVQKIQNKKTKGPTKKLTIRIGVDAYSSLRDQAIAQDTTVRKLAVALLSAA